MIWFTRNKGRFNNVLVKEYHVVNLIKAVVSMSGSFSKGVMSNNMNEFLILKAFLVKAHHSKAPLIKQVDWHPPPCGWTKCNVDGASRGNPGHASGSGLFRGHMGSYIGGFCAYFGT